MTNFIEVAFEKAKDILVEVGLPAIEEKVEGIVNDVVSKAKDFAQSIMTASKTHIHVIETTFLDVDGLKEIGRNYKAEGSTEVAAYKKVVNKQYVLYLAYTTDKELLPVEKNQYVVIKCKALAPDILELFDSQNLIILV